MVQETAPRKREPLAPHHKMWLGTGLLLVSGLAWVISLRQANDMATGGSLVGAFTFAGVWTVMMAAMMLPSLLPAVMLFAMVGQSRAQFGFRPVPTAVFVVGYLLSWASLGVVLGGVNAVTPGAMGAWSRPLIGGALLVAGAYQLTHWKAFCLGHCRSPIQFFMYHWRDGVAGATWVGMHYGLYCVACCWGLMLGLIALGMMSPAWMALMGLLIFVEKVAPRGQDLSRLIGGGLILAGAGIAIGWV